SSPSRNKTPAAPIGAAFLFYANLPPSVSPNAACGSCWDSSSFLDRAFPIPEQRRSEPPGRAPTLEGAEPPSAETFLTKPLCRSFFFSTPVLWADWSIRPRPGVLVRDHASTSIVDPSSVFPPRRPSAPGL